MPAGGYAPAFARQLSRPLPPTLLRGASPAFVPERALEAPWQCSHAREVPSQYAWPNSPPAVPGRGAFDTLWAGPVGPVAQAPKAKKSPKKLNHVFAIFGDLFH